MQGLQIYQLRRVAEPRERSGVGQTAADYKPSVADPGCQTWKQTLTRREESPISDAPLPAMRMAAQNQVDIPILKESRIVFGMMGEQKLITGLVLKF